MKERHSQIIFQTKAPCQIVWQIMTNNHDSSWRSDLDHIEVINELEFIEHGKKGSKIHFTISKKEPMKIYAFDMKDRNWTGHWIGEFKEENAITTVILTEYMKMNNPLLHLLSYVLFSLKKQQALYIHDLEEKLRSIL